MSHSGYYRVGDVIELDLDENTNHANSKRDNCSTKLAPATVRDQSGQRLQKRQRLPRPTSATLNAAVQL